MQISKRNRTPKLFEDGIFRLHREIQLTTACRHS